jgi:hypothetical protein
VLLGLTGWLERYEREVVTYDVGRLVEHYALTDTPEGGTNA